MKHWTDINDEDLSTRCLAFPCGLNLKCLETANLSELRPPSIAPKGNIGTPTRYFLRAINECRLSPKVIAKLGLRLIRKNQRAFSTVAPPTSVTDGASDKHSRVVHTSSSSSSTKNSNTTNHPENKEAVNDGDLDYEEEEWDRHRALHNDVSARRVVDNIDDLNDQPGTKERLFEEKMEVTWDKGSSGLVFYTGNLIIKLLSFKIHAVFSFAQTLNIGVTQKITKKPRMLTIGTWIQANTK